MASSSVYRLIVDTDSYAGNFERQSVAFVTGQVGECGVGRGEAKVASEELSREIAQWWGDHAEHVADDNGCHRPAMIVPTPGFFNHGMGGSFPKTEEGRVDGLADYKIEVGKYHSKNIDRLAHVEIGKNGWTEEAVKRERDRYQDEIDKANALTVPNEWPSYQSVAVQVDQEPPAEVVKSFQERMGAYLASKNIKVLGFFIETSEIPEPRAASRIKM